MSPQSGADVLSRSKRVKRRESIELCLRPDLVRQHATLGERLAMMTVKAGDRLASAHSADQQTIAQQMLDLEGEIQKHSVWFEFEALGKPEWQAIIDNNPPRMDHQLDVMTGYDRHAVLDDAIHAGLVDPVFDDCPGSRTNPDTGQREQCPHDDCGTYQQWEKETPPGEWDALRELVNLLNSEVVESPKSVLASRILGAPGNDSARPAATG